MSASAHLDICLKSLSHNYSAIQKRVAGRVLAPVVKSDAYGIGVDHIMPTLIDLGSKVFFVARISEGIKLRRRFGKNNQIFILDGFLKNDQHIYEDYALTPVINCMSQLNAFESYCTGKEYALHIDVGMRRLGINYSDINLYISNNYKNKLILIIGHLSCSDEPSNTLNSEQLLTFKSLLEKLPKAQSSLAASGGIFLGNSFHFDMVRPGICLYGGGPFGTLHPEIRPVATLRAQILQIQTLQRGDRIGYGGHFTVTHPMQSATLGIGYADGVLRSLSPKGVVYINGALKPILGRISMDLMSVDISDTGAKIGDMVEIFGPNLNIDDQAENAGTISYELLTRLSSRISRKSF